MINSFSGQYRWLSNFWPAEVMFDSALYTSVEHAYQAAKTVDIAQREQIRLAATAGIAKKLGRSVTMRPHWNEIKLNVMTKLVARKFAHHEYLRTKLLATGSEELVESNYWGDTYWGVCNNVGENNLGKILMAVRGMLMPTIAAIEMENNWVVPYQPKSEQEHKLEYKSKPVLEPPVKAGPTYATGTKFNVAGKHNVSDTYQDRYFG